jgi:hypothetical protein
MTQGEHWPRHPPTVRLDNDPLSELSKLPVAWLLFGVLWLLLGVRWFWVVRRAGQAVRDGFWPEQPGERG